MNLAEIAKQVHANDVDFGGARVMVVNVINSIRSGMPVYDAARGIWYLKDDDLERARQAEYVVALNDGVVEGVFHPAEWHPASEDAAELRSFAEHGWPQTKTQGRWAFTGEEIDNGWKGKPLNFDFGTYRNKYGKTAYRTFGFVNC